MRIKINGIGVDDVTRYNVVAAIEKMSLLGVGRQVVLLNLSLLKEAEGNAQLKEIIEAADLVLCVDKTMAQAAQIEQVQPLELRDALLKLSEERGLKLYLLTDEEGLGEQMVEEWQKNNPAIQVVGTEQVTIDFEDSRQEQQDMDLAWRVNKSGAQVVVVALSSPKQELWIGQNLKRFNTVLIGMGRGLGQKEGNGWLESLVEKIMLKVER